MSLLEIIILAVVQGLTEFLPVSSSGHLAVANAVLEALGHPPAADQLEVTIVLHLGTLLAVLIFFHREVVHLLRRDARLLPLLVVGTVPAVAVGLPLKYFATDWLESALLAGCMFPVTGAILIWASRREPGETSYRDISYGAAIKIGLLQAFALLPGISRSGATIAGGLACGLDRRSAGTFAFLLAIPAILGAGVLELKDLLGEQAATAATESLEQTAVTTSPMVLAVGTLVAMVVGLGALVWLIRWVQAGRLAQFAWYLFPLGAVVIAWQLAT